MQQFSLQVFLFGFPVLICVCSVLLVLKGFAKHVNHGLPNASHLPAVNQWIQTRTEESEVDHSVEV